jgi:hypothetical protein
MEQKQPNSNIKKVEQHYSMGDIEVLERLLAAMVLEIARLKLEGGAIYGKEAQSRLEALTGKKNELEKRIAGLKEENKK